MGATNDEFKDRFGVTNNVPNLDMMPDFTDKVTFWDTAKVAADIFVYLSTHKSLW
jgi:hypothetical protein